MVPPWFITKPCPSATAVVPTVVPPSKTANSVVVTALACNAPVPLVSIALFAVPPASFDNAILAFDLISAFTIFVIVLLSESIVCPSIVVVPPT